MTDCVDGKPIIWKESVITISWWLIVLVFLGLFFYDALSYMVRLWDSQEEYGHGYLIPLLAAFFIWQQKDKLEKYDFKGSWKSLLIVIPGMLMFFAGELASLYVVTQYAFIIVLIGLAYSYVGDRGLKLIAIPLLMLFFMIPLPNFLYNGLSAQLQLISTQIGVAVIRLMDISVYVEGNVIDLGVYKLQVVEACSGLRYLFPLMTLGFISAYIFNQAIWKKVVVFLSTIPITIFMNSLRIGLIGITVEYWGTEMAEGFLHDFEGWVVFMGCIFILVLEMWILVRIGKDKMTLSEAFGLELPAKSPEEAVVKSRALPKPFVASSVGLLLIALIVYMLPNEQEIQPERESFTTFPLEFDGWKGKEGRIEQVYLDALKLDDYVMNNYYDSNGNAINFYSAYYASQKKGASAHSPRSCIPGGGWQIASLERHHIEGVVMGGQPLVVNRLIIQRDDVKQLVYYWFQQRGRIITNEYAMKWFLLWDSITKNRTDGALVRLTTVVDGTDSLQEADASLTSFARALSGLLPEYVRD